MKKVLPKIFSQRLEITAFVTGMVILAFELTASRIVAPYLGSTIYVWTSIIGVILFALAVGYNYGGIFADRRKSYNDVAQLLILAAIIISVLNIFKEELLSSISGLGMSLQLQALFASLILFAAPTVCMGAVMPYLARLNITDVATSGQKLSHIDAAGTIGSLVGTFLTGYVLFGFIGTRNLLTLFSLLLILLTFLLVGKKYWWQRLVLAGIIAFVGLASPAPNLKGFLAEVDTAYNRVIIRDIYNGREYVRVLQTDSLGLQSGVLADGRKGLVIPYVQRFATTAELKKDANKYLIIGGGAFTFPEYLASRYPDSRVDAVEIDGRLADISRDYFYFKPQSNLAVIAADGRQYLNKNTNEYDMIFLDAFNSLTPPFQLLTQEAVSKMKNSLDNDGLIVANLISYLEPEKRQLIEATFSTFKSQFSNVAVYPVSLNHTANSLENVILIASDKPFKDKFSQTELKLDNKPDLVLRDDLAPVERYVFSYN